MGLLLEVHWLKRACLVIVLADKRANDRRLGSMGIDFGRWGWMSRLERGKWVCGERVKLWWKESNLVFSISSRSV